MVSSSVYMWIDKTSYEWVDSSEVSWLPRINESVYLKQIYTDQKYVYAVHTSGLNIIDIYLEELIAYIELENGFTTVCGNTTTVYLGTEFNGIMCIDKTHISGSVLTPCNLSKYLIPFYTMYTINSNNIINLFVLDKTLAITTSSGLDIIEIGSRGYKSSTNTTGITKSFLTSKKELYYISEINGWCVNKVNSCLCDWIEPDNIYKATESFIYDDVSINDIFVTENTSSINGYNTLFVATSSGTYIYDEGTEDFEVYYNKTYN